MRAILLTGVAGVGKTTLGRAAARQAGMDCWDYADLMLRVRPGLADKDAIGVLPWDERERTYQKVDDLLADYFAPGDGRRTCVVLENHLSVLDGPTVRTFPHEDIGRYNAAGLAVVEATPATVLRRRRRDGSRHRQIGTPREVREQQGVNRIEAHLIAWEWSLPLRFISNEERRPAISALARWIAEVSA